MIAVMVAGDPRCRGELPHGQPGPVDAEPGGGLRRRVGLRGGGVADDGPVRRGQHGEREGGLEVRLLEHREDTTRVRHLELRVEIRLAVDRVDEAVHALARVHVGEAPVDGEDVLLRQMGECDAAVLDEALGLQLLRR